MKGLWTEGRHAFINRPMTIRRSLGWGQILGMLFLTGCAMSDEQMAAKFIADMDAQPPEDRVPNWEATKALMLREAPKVGEEAPDFALATRDGSESIRLSQFEGDRPVVLVFGSWT